MADHLFTVNLSTVPTYDLQLTVEVLTSIGIPTMLADLRRAACIEIESRAVPSPRAHLLVTLIHGSLTRLSQCVPTPDLEEARLDQAWRALRKAAGALRAPKLKPQ